jgi:hypothetical protein
MTPDAYQLRHQSLTDLQRAEYARKAERIARIIERRMTEHARIAARLLTLQTERPTP